MNHERWTTLITLAKQTGLSTVNQNPKASRDKMLNLARRDMRLALKQKGISLCPKQRRKLKNIAEEFVLEVKDLPDSSHIY